MDMTDEARKAIHEMEAGARFPSGLTRIERGECPYGAFSPMACMACPEGHMLECHAGQTCDEAECNHWQAELEAEGEVDWQAEL